MSGSNPLIIPPSLNRIRASVLFQDFPQLSVTAPFLGKRGISLSFQGDATAYLETMTGAVTSPEVYLRCTLTIYLIKTLFLAQAFKTQLELSTLLGPATVRPDTGAMQPYNLTQCAVINPGDQDFSGADADYLIRIGGVYQVNAALFTQ